MPSAPDGRGAPRPPARDRRPRRSTRRCRRRAACSSSPTLSAGVAGSMTAKVSAKSVRGSSDAAGSIRRAKRQVMKRAYAAGIPLRRAPLHCSGRAAVTPGSNICRSERLRAERRSAARLLCAPAQSPPRSHRRIHGARRTQRARRTASGESVPSPQGRARGQVAGVVREPQRAGRERRCPLGLGRVVVVGEVRRTRRLHTAERRCAVERDREVALEEPAQDRVDERRRARPVRPGSARRR